MENFGQVITAMITPFNEDGSVDFAGAENFAEYLTQHGSDGVVVCGSTGEGATIDTEEKLELFSRIAKRLKGKGCVIANTGSNDTKKSVELTIAAEKTGVDGILAVVPYYNKPTQEGCYQHFKTIACSTKLPIILYNVPGRTSANLLPATIKRLADDCSNIVGVKEASGNVLQAAEISLLLPDFMIYSGDDSLTLPMLAVGGCGIISVVSNVCGQPLNDMITAFMAGDTVKARKLHQYMMPIMKDMFITTNPIPVKTCVSIMGQPAGTLHLPLVPATTHEVDILKETLKAYKLI